jgi:hypothetical protein
LLVGLLNSWKSPSNVKDRLQVNFLRLILNEKYSEKISAWLTRQNEYYNGNTSSYK